MTEREPVGGREPDGADAESQRIRALGGVLVSRLHGMLRGLRLYDPGNRALRTLQQELLETLRALETEEVTLLAMGGYFYVNGLRLRPDGTQLQSFRGVQAELERRRLSGLRFQQALDLEELEAFLRVFHASRSERAAEALEEAFPGGGGNNIRPILAYAANAQSFSDGEAEGFEFDRHRTRLVFRRVVDGTRDLIQHTARTGRPALRQARRVVQPIIDRLLRNELKLVGITALKRHDDYTYVHCVNVSILAIRMGQLLGLSRADLANLGVAALLHDTGKIAVPAEILSKPGKLEPAEWAAIQRHPIEGLLISSRMPDLSWSMLDSMRVAFEHHMNIDHTGYPKVREPREMAPFSRIVAVSDVFDAVTSHRSYRKRPLTAHEALRLLVGREAAHFDRAALWALVRTVGLYPAGTLMRTESGRLWLSVAPSPADVRRPVCRELLTGPDGAIVAATGVDDAPLAEDERVTAVLTPEDLNADVEMLLAA